MSRRTAGRRRIGQDGGGQAGEADGAGQHLQGYTAQGRARHGFMCASVCVRAVSTLPSWKRCGFLPSPFWLALLLPFLFGSCFPLPPLRGGAVPPLFDIK